MGVFKILFKVLAHVIFRLQLVTCFGILYVRGFRRSFAERKSPTSIFETVYRMILSLCLFVEARDFTIVAKCLYV